MLSVFPVVIDFFKWKSLLILSSESDAVRADIVLEVRPTHELHELQVMPLLAPQLRKMGFATIWYADSLCQRLDAVLLRSHCQGSKKPPEPLAVCLRQGQVQSIRPGGPTDRREACSTPQCTGHAIASRIPVSLRLCLSDDAESSRIPRHVGASEPCSQGRRSGNRIIGHMDSIPASYHDFVLALFEEGMCDSVLCCFVLRCAR